MIKGPSDAGNANGVDVAEIVQGRRSRINGPLQHVIDASSAKSKFVPCRGFSRFFSHFVSIKLK